jgi:hypothetical protein
MATYRKKGFNKIMVYKQGYHYSVWFCVQLVSGITSVRTSRSGWLLLATHRATIRAARFEALGPIRQGVRGCFGAFCQEAARGLTLRRDHGGQYASDHFQNETRFLGITASPAFVREPEGSGRAGRFIRTLNENLLSLRTFQTVEELRQVLL